MVFGWRRAFCSSIPKDRVRDRDGSMLTEKRRCKANTNSPRGSSKFGFFSNPSTPTLRCRTTAASSAPTTPKKTTSDSPRLFKVNPSSPKSPSSFSLLKSTLRLSSPKQRSGCGICALPVRSGQGTAIFTAECSHLFHFPCIAAHLKPNPFLVCPVCNTAWPELPLLAPHEPISDKIKSLRVYDDDEPLVSPTSRARFNPIPESNEDEDDGPTEFQGFFVNPTFSPSPKSSHPAVAVTLLPEAAILSVGRGFQSYAAMMRVKGPPALSPRRAPIDLVTVLEVSGKMTGNKLLTLKRAMRLLISSLSEADRLSVVAFSAASKRLLPLRRMTPTGRRSARRIVDALGSTGQGMCVSDALKKAAKVLEDRRQQNSAASIILLSDGQNARGPTVSSTRFSHLDIPVHAVSIVDGHAPSDEALGKCLRSLLTVVVQDLRIQLGLASGPGPAQVTAVYSLTGKPTILGSGLVRLGDIFAEEERELLVELRVPTSSAGSHQFLSVRSSYKDPASGSLVHTKDQALTVPRPQTVRSSSPTIKRLRNLHVTVRAIAESRRLIEHNDLSAAHHLLSSARALLMKSGSGSSEEFLRGLEAEQAELQRRRLQNQKLKEGNGALSRVEQKNEPLTPTSAWRAAEKLANVAIMRKSMNRVSDLHGFENARF